MQCSPRFVIAPAPSSKTAVLHLGGTCGLSCAPLCDCSAGASRDPLELLRGGGRTVELRGNGGPEALGQALSAARREGFEQRLVRTNAAGADASAPERWAAQGATAVVAPLFSSASAVHDRLAGQKGALVQLLVTLRAADAAGLAVELEVPLLPSRLQPLDALLGLARRAVPRLAGVRFHLPRTRLDPAIAPEPWSVAGPRLAQAIATCRALGVKADLRTPDAIPFCALKGAAELLDAFKFRPRKPVSLAGCDEVDACRGCAMRVECPKVARSYLAAHGGFGIEAFATRPAALTAQATSPRRVWTEAAKRAASLSKLLVLRPTVNCNQDCTFCSANETSKNVWADPKVMLRSIARGARRGVNRLSFSGGEPTLSKHLPAFVRAARRAGIDRVELVSNGVLLDRPARVKELVDAGLTDVFFSLHAHDEALSRTMTQKEGDFQRTVAAARGFLEAGLVVAFNHVITSRNYPFLAHFVEMVHREFGTKALISFAFVTPQYKALEDLSIVPRLSDVQPVLRRALWRALELEQSVVVGSRQGVPPCFLGEFQGWSDVALLNHEAAAEDAPQKAQVPACGECRYRGICTGLWKPYLQRYGGGEVEPIRGPAFSEAELQSFRSAPFTGSGGRLPAKFEELPEVFRDRAKEALGPPAAAAEPARAAFSPARSRPVRVLLAGTGRQARRLALAAQHVEGFSIDGVASPHALQADLAPFGNVAAWADAAEAIAAFRPEGVIIAASTAAHLELTRAALAAGVPVLLEKPLAGSLAEAEALAALPGAERISCAHNLVFSPGLTAVLKAPLAVVRRVPRTAPDALHAWSRAGLLELLHHLAAVVCRAAADFQVLEARWTGSSPPGSVRFGLSCGSLELQLDAEEDVLAVTSGGTTWERRGRSVTLTRGGVTAPTEERGSDVERMLAAFRDQVSKGAAPAVPVREGLAVLKGTVAMLDALEAAGAPLSRQHAPVHVKSPSFRARTL